MHLYVYTNIDICTCTFVRACIPMRPSVYIVWFMLYGDFFFFFFFVWYGVWHYERYGVWYAVGNGTWLVHDMVYGMVRDMVYGMVMVHGMIYGLVYGMVYGTCLMTYGTCQTANSTWHGLACCVWLHVCIHRTCSMRQQSANICMHVHNFDWYRRFFRCGFPYLIFPDCSSSARALKPMCPGD